MNILQLAKAFFKSEHKLLHLSQYFSSAYVPAYPQSATIETTNICNLRCPVCETNKVSKREKGYMSFEKFKTIADELCPHLDDVELYSWGEPFLNNDIYEMISYVKEKFPKVYTYLDTNGNVMDVEHLFKNPPDEIVFGIDGLDQKTYEKYRYRGDLEKVLKNLKDCIEAKRRLKLDRPKLVVKFICMKHNEHQLERLPEFVRDIGADDYRIELFTSRTVEHARQFMSTIPAYQKYDPVELEKGRLVPYMKQLTTPCHMLWIHAGIDWDGNVGPCCTDYDGLYNWGNIFEDGGFWQVWNSKKAKAFRRMHRSSSYRSKISICRDCYLTNCVLDEKIQQRLSTERSNRNYKKD